MLKIRNILLTIYKMSFFKLMRILITIGDIVLSYPIGFIASFKHSKAIPPIVDEILLTPATVLARQVREKEITSEKIVTTFISRIEKVNPILNAIVEDRFAKAVEEAKKVDLIIANTTYTSKELEEKYPLLGVPVTIKESIAVRGMSHKAGMICSRGKASEDADVVGKIKAAGAIITAITNTPELCMDWECYNNITGRTSNPYDTRRTTGASSGGEAALVSSAASVIGIGSDALGSLRLPAHFCGLFSHKPTGGVVSAQGHFPHAEEKDVWEKVLCIGPMARYAVDLPVVLKIICKDDVKESLRLDKEIDYSKLKIFYMEYWDSELVHPVIPEIVSAIHATATHFQQRYKTRIQKWHNPELTRVAEISLAFLLSIKGMDDIFGNDPEKSVILELFKFLLGISEHTLTPIGYTLLSRYLPAYNLKRVREKIASVKRTVSNILDNDGVLICPTFPVDATYHKQLFSKSYNNIYMSTFNSLGLPVSVCPVGFSKKGLPIGLQIVGKPNCDHLTIAVAQEMEALFGGWRKP